MDLNEKIKKTTEDIERLQEKLKNKKKELAMLDNPNYHGNYHRGQHSHGAVFWQQGPVQPGQDESDDVRFRPVCGGASVRAALPA